MIIKFDNVNAEIVCEDAGELEIANFLRKNSKVDVPGAKYTPAYNTYRKTKGQSGWSGKKSLYGRKFDFPTGILPSTLGIIWEQFKHLPTLEDHRPFSSHGTTRIGAPIPGLREYQRQAWQSGIQNQFNGMWWPRGIFDQATGAGKTELAIALYGSNQVPTLFVVHLKSLGEQTVERFRSYGFECGQFFDSVREFGPNLTVATIQSLCANMDDPEVQALLNNTAQVFWDEAHLIAANASKGNWFVSLSHELPNAYCRWGLTATPFKKDDYSNVLLAGATGKVLYSIKNKELIEQKFLTPAKVKMVTVPAVHKCPKKWPACYDDGILLNKARTDLLVKELATLPKPCFVFTTRTAHVDILMNAIIRDGRVKVAALTGKDDLDTRRDVLNDLRSGELEAIVCTTIFDEGINFPELASIIMAGGGSSEVKTLQRIGRGLRVHESKECLEVVDFIDTSTRILKEHSNERRRIYEDQGFEVKVV